MNLVMLIKTDLYETRVEVNAVAVYNLNWQHRYMNLSDRFPIQNGPKQGDGLLPQVFKFPSHYAIRKLRKPKRGWEGIEHTGS